MLWFTLHMASRWTRLKPEARILIHISHEDAGTQGLSRLPLFPRVHKQEAGLEVKQVEPRPALV